MGIGAHSFCRAFIRSGTDVGQEDLARNFRSSSSQRCSMGLRSGLCAGQSSSSTPNSSNYVFIVLALCTGVQSCWNRKGPFPNSCHMVGSIALSKMYWCAEPLRLPFTGDKKPSLNPEKQPLLHQTSLLAQCSQAGNV